MRYDPEKMKDILALFIIIISSPLDRLILTEKEEKMPWKLRPPLKMTSSSPSHHRLWMNQTGEHSNFELSFSVWYC